MPAVALPAFASPAFALPAVALPAVALPRTVVPRLALPRRAASAPRPRLAAVQVRQHRCLALRPLLAAQPSLPRVRRGRARRPGRRARVALLGGVPAQHLAALGEGLAVAEECERALHPHGLLLVVGRDLGRRVACLRQGLEHLKRRRAVVLALGLLVNSEGLAGAAKGDQAAQQQLLGLEAQRDAEIGGLAAHGERALRVAAEQAGLKQIVDGDRVHTRRRAGVRGHRDAALLEDAHRRRHRALAAGLLAAGLLAAGLLAAGILAGGILVGGIHELITRGVAPTTFSMAASARALVVVVA